MAKLGTCHDFSISHHVFLNRPGVVFVGCAGRFALSENVRIREVVHTANTSVGRWAAVAHNCAVSVTETR